MTTDFYEERDTLRARVEELEAWFRLTERPFRKYPSRFVDEDLDESDEAWALHSRLIAALSHATLPLDTKMRLNDQGLFRAITPYVDWRTVRILCIREDLTEFHKYDGSWISFGVDTAGFQLLPDIINILSTDIRQCHELVMHEESKGK